MKKNLYYRSVFKRTNAFKEFFLGFFLLVCSWPRLLLEVFIRRNFGERYFSLATGITIVAFIVLLHMLPFLGLFIYTHFDGEILWRLLDRVNWGKFWAKNLTGYLFLGAFLVMCFRRQREIERLPSVFDFGRFSLCAGQIHPVFLNIQINGKPVSVRLIETLLEPGVFFAAGVVLWGMHQTLGLVLIVSSLFYSLSYVAAYYQGDQFVMDKIDEMICNEELVKAFVEGRSPDETRGFNFYGRRPADPDLCRLLAENFIEEDDAVLAL